QIQMSMGEPLVYDQRGAPRFSNGTVDIGAFEGVQSLVVSTLQDNHFSGTDAVISLRAAIELANTMSTPQTITFAPGVKGTITLTLGELQITNSMTIDGPGAKLLSISGNNTSRVFEIDNPTSGVSDVTISGLSIINGYGFHTLADPGHSVTKTALSGTGG